jgi:hypothetical protein
MRPTIRTTQTIKDQATRAQVERLISFLPPFLGELDADPSAGDFGARDEGVFWYSRTSHAFKYWNGSAIKTVMAS